MTGVIHACLAPLLSMGDHHPFWELAIFALCVWIVYGIVEFGEDVRETRA